MSSGISGYSRASSGDTPPRKSSGHCMLNCLGLTAELQKLQDENQLLREKLQGTQRLERPRLASVAPPPRHSIAGDAV
eukprot:2387083-Prymnesium_polylepis.1